VGVRFVDIGEIIEHHCVNFLFIIMYFCRIGWYSVLVLVWLWYWSCWHTWTETVYI